MPTAVTVSVVWISADEKPLPWRLLADAVVALERRQPNSVVIWACTAVEAAAYDFVDGQLRAAKIGTQRRRPFLEDQATFSGQLNVLLPLILHLRGATPINDRSPQPPQRPSEEPQRPGSRQRYRRLGQGPGSVEGRRVWVALLPVRLGCTLGVARPRRSAGLRDLSRGGWRLDAPILAASELTR